MNAGALANTRLADFARVSTASVDDAAEAIGRIFCPHELKPTGHSENDFSAQHNCAAFDGFSVNYVAYGGSVSIDPGCLDRFFLLQIPLHGCAEIRTAARAVTTAPGAAASLLSPTVPTQMTWRQDCAQLILLLDRKLVEHRAAARGNVGESGGVRSVGRPHRTVWTCASGTNLRSRRSRRAPWSDKAPVAPGGSRLAGTIAQCATQRTAS